MIRTDDDTGLFGADGLPIAFSTLQTGETATAIGFFVGERINDLRVLDALVVQYGPRLDSGSSASRYSGFTTTSIDGSGRFNLLLDPPGQGLAEETLDIALQAGAALITREGERLQPTEIGVGAEVITEGILIDDELRASLLVVNMDGEAEQVLEGVLVDVDVDDRVLTITSNSPATAVCASQRTPTSHGSCPVKRTGWSPRPSTWRIWWSGKATRSRPLVCRRSTAASMPR
jgi:hypothetical protein